MAQPKQSADPRLLALVAAYQTQTVGLRVRLDRFVRALWRSFRLHDDAARDQYVTQVGPAITGAQATMASLTVAYLAHQREIVLGVPFEPVSVDPKLVTGAAVRNGVPRDVVDARPFNTFWYELSRLTAERDAIANALMAGEMRAATIALTDLQLAKTHTQQIVTAQDSQVSYTRRVLEGASSCGLCIVASTQRYAANKLMPIHPGCDCSQQTVWVDRLPGRVIDLQTLQDVHERIEQRFGASSPSGDVIPGTEDPNGLALRYRDVLITHEHGELGPILGIRGQKFSTLDELVTS